MHLARTRLTAIGMLLFLLLVAACGQNSSSSKPSAAAPLSSSPTSSSASAETTTKTPGTRSYTDRIGRTVEIPASPERVVYIGSNPGDLLAIGLKPAGASLSVIASQIAYPDLIAGIPDVGYPYDPEKVLDLTPDLIIFDDWDDKGIDALQQIAPTVVVGMDDAPVKERVMRVADVTGHTQEAEDWFNAYDAKVAALREKLNPQANESALSLLLMGDKLYVMGDKGLNSTLYDRLGYKPTDGVQKLIDDKQRFADISYEVLPEYAGTRIFILSSADDETASAQATLTGSALWNTIPAVRDGRVHLIDSKYNFDDPITLDRLLDELDTMLASSSAASSS